jgi:hypothetical protein
VTELELPMAPDPRIGASCTLGAADLPGRVAEWRSLRDRAIAVEAIEGGARLRFAPEEPIDAIARLVALESECCAFYRFTIQVGGSHRELTVDAGPGGAPAVHALLGLPG